MHRVLAAAAVVHAPIPHALALVEPTRWVLVMVAQAVAQDPMDGQAVAVAVVRPRWCKLAIRERNTFLPVARVVVLVRTIRVVMVKPPEQMPEII
ncbi:hypothetical protein PHIN7_13230 [Polynucleobacter sp. HIN7]|nr:hypothetical protein PHIN7_13230 [Polynucleobacter sp. HIN7]